ncbi:MAG TPA: G1 family glutamic endopeptidase [Acidimicrobiales bacterium]|nr:G1 family glutamic endopeptidase [Acidimicrobiales bacterium]
MTAGEARPPRPARRAHRPAILLIVAILLAGAVAVVAKPLTATAASTRTSAAGRHARTHDSRTGNAVKAVKVIPGVATSPNWSGYVAYASYNEVSFNQVSAQWTEPAVTCPKKNAWTLFWVGFDGWPKTDGTVEQGGTSAQCVGGVPQYRAFFEMWPTMAVTTLFSVNAGDRISARVVYSPNTQQFLITVTDITSGISQTKTQSCAVGLACARTSAEWVAESPSHFGTKMWFPLANYGTMNFTEAQATDTFGVTGPISDSHWVNSGIERIAGSAKALAKVSTLQTSGSGTSTFSDTWHHK